LFLFRRAAQGFGSVARLAVIAALLLAAVGWPALASTPRESGILVSPPIIESAFVQPDGASLTVRFNHPMRVAGQSDRIALEAGSGARVAVFGVTDTEQTGTEIEFTLLERDDSDVVWTEYKSLTGDVALRDVTLLQSTDRPMPARLAVINGSERSLGGTRYVVSPSDARRSGGIGSALDPWTAAEAQRRAADGMTIRLKSGIWRERLDQWPSGLANVTIESEDPSSPAFLRGDRVVPPGGWEDLGDGAYAVKVFVPVFSVVWNWDSNLTSESDPGRVPRHYGHLTPRSSRDEVAASPGSWWRDDGTGRLYISPPPGAAPPTEGDEYAYCVGGSALLVDEWTNSTIRNVKTGLYVRADGAQQGYGVRCESSRGMVIENIVGYDHGRHFIGCVDEVSVRNEFRNCVAFGGHSVGSVNQNPYVFAGGRPWRFDETQRPADNVGVDLVWHAYPLLGFDGEPIPEHFPDGNISGRYRGLMLNSHSAGANRMEGISWIRPVLLSYAEQDGLALRTQLVGASDENDDGPRIPREMELDPEAYPIQVIDGYAEVVRAAIKPAPMAAFVRCRFFSESNEARRARSITELYHHGNSRQTLYLACLFWDRGEEDGSRLNSMIRAQDHSRVVVAMSTFYQDADNFKFAFLRDSVQSSYGPGTRAVQSVFAFRTPGGPNQHRFYWPPGPGVADQTLEVESCWFHNVDPNKYVHVDQTFNDMHEFEASIAPASQGNIFDLAPGFSAASTGDLKPAPGAPLDQSKWFLPAFDGRLGLASNPYAGRYGAFQPPCPADLNHDGGVDARDLAQLLPFWTRPAPPDALEDLNGDGFVDGRDLGLLLPAWGPCEP